MHTNHLTAAVSDPRPSGRFGARRRQKKGFGGGGGVGGARAGEGLLEREVGAACSASPLPGVPNVGS